MIENNQEKIAIVIATWDKGKNDLIMCLRSLEKLIYSNYEVIVVDNKSEDDTIVCVKKYFSWVNLIENPENLGFCGGYNTGIKLALKRAADYVFLLNSDMVVDPKLLNFLVKTASSDKKIGIVGAVIYSFRDRDRLTFRGANLNRWFSTTRPAKKRVSANIFEADYVGGSSMLVKREVAEKIGLLDERFFAYFEDFDWCLRAKRAGYKVVYDCRAKVWHKREGYKNLIKLKNNSWLNKFLHVFSMAGEKIPSYSVYYVTRNRPLFMRENVSIFQFIVFMFFFTLAYLPMRTVFFIITKRIDLLKVFIRGFLDFLLGRFGKAL